jgi:hypothetical protein
MTISRSTRWAIPLLATLWTSGTLAAQTTAVPLLAYRPELDGLPAGGGLTPVQDTTGRLPCPDCDPPKRFWAAFGELMATQMVPFSINHFVRDAEWADVSPSTWATNLENPWKWDNNKFTNNQFAHPYHGSLYYNSARSNGYNFWESAPWAFGGSLMWEFFGEAWAPSPNDLWNTSLGGISLGEMLWRVSSLTLDNTATGTERTFREIGATLLNPVRGFNRIVRGETNDITANPPDWRPTKIFASLDVGYKRVVGENNSGQGGEVDVGYAGLFLSYGDQVEDIDGSPFSAFTVRAELSTNQGDQGHLSMLTARGNLAAATLSSEGSTQHRLGAFMFYEYNATPAFEFGGQGFAGGLVSRWGDPKGRRIQSRLLATAWPIVATRSDYFVTLEGRDYDYGVGLGAEAAVTAIDEGKWAINATGRYIWEPILSGFNGDHYQAAGTLEGRFYLWGKVGLGASGTVYWRNSVYDDFADVQVDATQIRAYTSLAIPRWAP